jgi:hypothetical protein
MTAAEKILQRKQATVGTTPDALRASLWKLSRNPDLTPTELHRQSAQAVVDWLHARGRFYRDERRQDFGGVSYFDTASKILSPVQGDSFQSWLAEQMGVNRTERIFVFAVSAVESEGMSARSNGITPAAYWASRPGACYLSNGPGHMARITGKGVQIVDNGSDGVLFASADTLPPWAMDDDGVDPFTTCRLFAGMAAASPHGKLLFQLWAMGLPTDPTCKPPLCVSSGVGGGKTTLIRGLFALYGLSEQINAVSKSGDVDFWTVADAGGLACLDNADTRVEWLADALAAAATAGTYSKRRLYTDSDKVILRSRAWLAITSANPTFASDSGLADRLLVVRLNRRTGETAESSLFDEVRRNRDSGLTWICRKLSAALADRESVPSGLNARHPDWAASAFRIGRSCGLATESEAALRAAESDKGLFCIQNDSIGATVLELLGAGPFTGTASELLQRMIEVDPALDGRLSAKAVGKRINKLWPHLESACCASLILNKNGATTYSLKLPAVGVLGVFKHAKTEKSPCEENINTFAEIDKQIPLIPPTTPPNAGNIDLFQIARERAAADRLAMDVQGGTI